MSPARKKDHIVASTKLDVSQSTMPEVESLLDRYPDYRLIGMTSHQVGIGHGSYVQVICAFKLKEGK